MGKKGKKFLETKDSAVRLATEVIRDQDEKVRAKVAKGQVRHAPVERDSRKIKASESRKLQDAKVRIMAAKALKSKNDKSTSSSESTKVGQNATQVNHKESGNPIHHRKKRVSFA